MSVTEVVPYGWNPQITFSTLYNIADVHAKPVGGDLVFQCINTPTTFHAHLGKFNHIFTFTDLQYMIKHRDKDLTFDNCHSDAIMKLYNSSLATPMAFCSNFIPYGVTSISNMEKYEISISDLTYRPIVICGRPQKGTCKEDRDSLRLPINLTEEVEHWKENSRYYVYLVVDLKYNFKFVITTHATYEAYDKNDDTLDCLLNKKKEDFWECCIDYAESEFKAYTCLGWFLVNDCDDRTYIDETGNYYRLPGFVFDSRREWIFLPHLPILHLNEPDEYVNYVGYLFKLLKNSRGGMSEGLKQIAKRNVTSLPTFWETILDVVKEKHKND